MESLEAQRKITDDLAALLEDGEDHYSDLQLYFLRRLNRLLGVRRQGVGQLKPSEVRLLDRALFAAYRDCTAEDVGAEAEKMLQLLGSRPTRSHGSEN